MGKDKKESCSFKDILINQAIKGRESIWPMIDSWTSARLCGLYWCLFVKLWFRVVLMLHYFCLSGRSSPLSLPSSRCGSQILAWRRKFDLPIYHDPPRISNSSHESYEYLWWHLPCWSELLLVVAQVPLAHHVGLEAKMGKMRRKKRETKRHLSLK